MPAPVMVVLHGRNTVAHEHPWSMMVRMALWLHLSGSPVIKSIAIFWNGRVLIWLGIRYTGVVTVDESVREEDRSDDEEKDENVKNIICQLLDQRTASQRRDKSCAPSH